MKCKTCNQEIIDQTTIKIPELKIEVDMELSCKGKSFEEIKKLIPKGKRLLRHDEIIKLYNNKKHRKLLGLNNTWEFIEPFLDGMFVARFFADSGSADVSCYGNPQDSDAALGVRFCKEVK